MSAGETPWWSTRTDKESDEVATSPELWRPLADAVGGFDTDPASGAESTPIAETAYTKADDGLSKPWPGTVWLNPPGSEKDAWYHRLVDQYQNGPCTRAVALAWGQTSSAWYQDHFTTADVICQLEDRDQFVGRGDNPSFSVWVGVWNPNDAVLDVLESRGALLVPVENLNTDQRDAEAFLGGDGA